MLRPQVFGQDPGSRRVRSLFVTFFVSLAGFGALAVFSQVVANSRYLQNSAIALDQWGHALPEVPLSERTATIDTALQRSRRYDSLINSTHLVDGMVVNRTATGRMLDQCDSLLFSSLRFVSLSKLGLDGAAGEAWHAIEGSQADGHWLRHPRCPKSTSRDMLLGLMVAMSQRPSGYRQHLQTLIERVGRYDGYFSTGPAYVSYLTPGVARLLGMLAPESDLPRERLPDIVKNGYSTAELTLYGTGRGYEAHLIALSVWLEMELAHRFGADEKQGLTERWLAPVVRPFSRSDLHAQRLEWITTKLVEIDRQNLFFRYLRLKAAGAMTPSVAHRLLTELLAMPEFPEDHLPTNCDRRADYLWQRSSREYQATRRSCTAQFSGTDFLWMASLLVESMKDAGLASAH
jgi:hypothetical protein